MYSIIQACAAVVLVVCALVHYSIMALRYLPILIFFGFAVLIGLYYIGHIVAGLFGVLF